MGSDNTNHDRAIRREGCGSMNNNGEDTWILHDIRFRHWRDTVVAPWKSTSSPGAPSMKETSHINHLMINGTWRWLQDVRVRRGADVSGDYRFVTSTLKLKLRRNGPGKARQLQFDVQKLKEPRAKRTFILQLKNKFWALADADSPALIVQKYAESFTFMINEWKFVRLLQYCAKVMQTIIDEHRALFSKFITDISAKHCMDCRTLKR